MMVNCAICGSASAKEVKATRSVTLLGRTESFVRREFACAACGETYTDDEQGTANEREERRATQAALREIGPDEIRALRSLIDITQSELEAALGVGQKTVARWETKGRPIPNYIKTAIRLLALNPSAAVLLRDQSLPLGERIDSEVPPPRPSHLVVVRDEAKGTDLGGGVRVARVEIKREKSKADERVALDKAVMKGALCADFASDEPVGASAVHLDITRQVA